MQKAPREYRYLFGPVPSRRFGRSLGVDLVPAKTCSFNCVYCQLGRTANPCAERREWVPTAAVLDEIRHWMRHDGQADVITLAGSGEPTLHSQLGEILEGIREARDTFAAGAASAVSSSSPKARAPLPICILTNGSLLHLPAVREAAARADIVKVTFSAPDAAVWQRLHRPAPGLRFEDALEGLRAFRKRFRGELRLEVMLIDGINAEESQVRRIAELARAVRPDRIELNTAVRPPAEEGVRAVNQDRLESLALLFEPRAEVIRSRSSAEEIAGPTGGDIVAIIRRHPATAEEIAAALRLSEAEALDRLRALCGDGSVFCRNQAGENYYSAPGE